MTLLPSGTSDIVLIETDESDGSIVKFHPRISVITNISKDHKELSELKELFQTFAGNTSGTVIINGDCAESKIIAARQTVTFGLEGSPDVKAHALRFDASGTTFQVGDALFHLHVPGLHNVYNAAAAIAVGFAMDIPVKAIQEGIAAFTGIQRRLDIVGSTNNITVVDDFAHNPDKIVSSIKALKQM